MITFRIIARVGDPKKKSWTDEEIETEKHLLQNDLENNGEIEVDDISFVQPLREQNIDESSISVGDLRYQLVKRMGGDTDRMISLRELVLLFKELYIDIGSGKTD